MKQFIKKCFITCILLFNIIVLRAQTINTIALGNTTNLDSEVTAGDVSMYESAALTGIREAKLCTVLERKEWENILREKGIQKTEDFLNGKIVEQGMALGAEYLLLITIQSMNITESKTAYSNTNIFTKAKEEGWTREVTCSIILGAKVVSISNGIVKYNKTFTFTKKESSNDKSGHFSTSKEDIAAGMKTGLASQCRANFSHFIYEVFPPTIEIIKIEEQKTQGKKEKAERVLCKTSSSLIGGSSLEVFIEELLTVGTDNMVRKKSIGALRVLQMEGEKIALCKVVDGGDLILQKMNEKALLKCSLISSENKSLPGITLPKMNLDNLFKN
jgi:hypothetical protein